MDSDFICVRICVNAVLRGGPFRGHPAPSRTVWCVMCQHHWSKLDQASASYSLHIAGIPHALMAW